jgi:hypothetical protein
MERSVLFIVFFCFFSKFNKQCIRQRFIQDHLLFLTALHTDIEIPGTEILGRIFNKKYAYDMLMNLLQAPTTCG